MKKFFLLLAVLLCGTAIAQEPQNSQQDSDPASDEAAQAGAEANPEDTIQYAGILNVIGDSYVRNHKCPIEETWHYKMAKELNLKYNNYGRNGSCIAWDRTNDGKHNFGPAIVDRAWDMEPDADYVLVIAGHNDACKIGDSKDSAEMFRDSMEVLIANIRTQCPNAKIGFVTPWYVPRLGFDLTCKVMKQVCDKHYVPVLWNHSTMGFFRFPGKTRKITTTAAILKITPKTTLTMLFISLHLSARYWFKNIVKTILFQADRCTLQWPAYALCTQPGLHPSCTGGSSVC